MRPLDGAKSDPYLLEIIEVFQFAENLIIKVGFGVEPFDTAIVELQVKGEIVISCYRDNSVHLNSSYLSGSILNTCWPFTANVQSAISSS